MDVSINEFQADWFGRFDASARVCQQAGRGVSGEDLDLVGVAAGHEQILSVGSQNEVAWMDARWLIARLAERAILGVNAENGQSVAFQAVGGVEEASVRREVDVGAASGV